MTLQELVTFEIKTRGVTAPVLAVRCDVSPYVIRSIYHGRKVGHEFSEKVAAEFGYAVETKLVQLIEGKE